MALPDVGLREVVAFSASYQAREESKNNLELFELQIQDFVASRIRCATSILCSFLVHFIEWGEASVSKKAKILQISRILPTCRKM